MGEKEVVRVVRLLEEVRGLAKHATGIALDFDGVCKLFTKHKHQIMATCLFLHLREFQRVPFDIYRNRYVYINFRSPEYSGKERFVCVNALAEHLAEQGYDCALPGLSKAVATLKAQGEKVNASNLQRFAASDDVARALAWSADVDERIGQLTEIGLTPGILENILEPFRDSADFYVVSTATEASLRSAMEDESIDYILRYFGQETASKAEALLALCGAGYDSVLMFGDSTEDERAAQEVTRNAPTGVVFAFVPVIPDDEERCFKIGRLIIEAMQREEFKEAEGMANQLAEEFKGREAGSKSVSPMSISET